MAGPDPVIHDKSDQQPHINTWMPGSSPVNLEHDELGQLWSRDDRWSISTGGTVTRWR